MIFNLENSIMGISKQSIPIQCELNNIKAESSHSALFTEKLLNKKLLFEVTSFSNLFLRILSLLGLSFLFWYWNICCCNIYIELNQVQYTRILLGQIKLGNIETENRKEKLLQGRCLPACLLSSRLSQLWSWTRTVIIVAFTFITNSLTLFTSVFIMIIFSNHDIHHHDHPPHLNLHQHSHKSKCEETVMFIIKWSSTYFSHKMPIFALDWSSPPLTFSLVSSKVRTEPHLVKFEEPDV